MEAIPKLGFLGGGQLGRMLVEEANRLNIPVNVLDVGNSAAKQIHNHPSAEHVDGSFADAGAVEKLIAKSDILTIEIEHVDTNVLESLDARVEPSWQTIRTIQDKYAQKLFLSSRGIATADAIPVETADDLNKVATTFNFPIMLKARKQAYDGRGNYVVASEDDIPAAISALGSVPGGMYAERWANFQTELAVMVVKTKDQVLAYPTVELVSQDSVCKLVYAPARHISQKVALAAQELAKKAVAPFEGKGVYGVELFLLENDKLLVNEIAPRPHNSGHYTIEACTNSQFAAHLRAVLDLPLPAQSLSLLRPSIMLNILSGKTPSSHLKLLHQALAVPNATVHLYGKDPSRPGRKIGHITVTGSTINEAETAIQPLIHTVNAIRAERLGLASPKEGGEGAKEGKSKIHPVVGVISGSISDQPHLEPCYQLLERFGIPYERGIKSAHRTPDLMAQYAKTATERGIKVIIAAAGGAAHLPGMVAAFGGSVPVIGVPIKPTIGDGTDSLLSMTNMPRGVPVLTVGVNNSTNAALSAARIVAQWDDRVKEAVLAYSKEACDESQANDERMIAENAERLTRSVVI